MQRIIEKITSRKTVLFFILAMVISVASCTKAIIDEEEIVDPIDEEVTYSVHVSTLMTNHCITCHSGLNPLAGLDLSTYSNARASAEMGAMLARIEDGASPMPPSGLMSAADRATIQQWATEGYKE